MIIHSRLEVSFVYKEAKEEAMKGNTKKVSGGSAGREASHDKYFPEDFYLSLDYMFFPIYIIDPENFQVLYCNRAMQKHLGWNPVGEKCYKVMRGMDAPCDSCSAMRLYRDRDFTPKEVRVGDGVWALLQASPLYWKEKEYIQITCVDISKRKRLEEELYLRNKEYGAVVRKSITGIMRYDIEKDRAVVNVDRNLDRVDEYTIDNYIKVVCGSSLIERNSVPIAKSILNDIRSRIPGRGYDLQLALERDGLRWIHIDYILIDDAEGKPYRAVVSFFDNTEQRERELAYQNWNTRLNAIMDEHAAYMWVNLSSDFIEVENRFSPLEENMGGQCYSEVMKKRELEGIFEEDRIRFRNFFDRERLLGQFLAGSKESCLEYRVVEEGTPRWHRAELQMIRDPSGESVKASIILSNVDVDFREREQLTRRAERDSMTDLYNHATLENVIRGILEQKTGERSCFLIIDLDDLSDINSCLGHPEGDRALQIIADCMRMQFGRESILGRIGGDEFAALLRDISEEEVSIRVSDFLNKVNEHSIGPQADWPVHVSVGGAIGTEGDSDFQTLYYRADLALYYTKAMGKNAFHLYEPKLEHREFKYHPRSSATLAKMDAFDSSEFKKLLQAVSAYFPMVISVNLTKNTYYMMEYMSYTMQKHKEEGCFDQLIEDGADSFHPNDRESFRQAFSRKSLLQAYERGERMVRHTGRQLGDDGVYRVTRGVVVFVDDEEEGDICEITFSRASFDLGKNANAHHDKAPSE
ncbi:MAG: diguanylate cyclase [Eubacteriales bacterium]|nr:diguanylate cyclase [Eubacteriales bacterium]